MWSDSDDNDFEPQVLPAVLQRPVVANHIVTERVTVETSDHEDHTFCGIMFDVRCIDSLPIEYLEITSVAVRGALGPMTVWTTPLTHEGKFRNYENNKVWNQIYEQTHAPSMRRLVPLEFPESVRLSAGQSCGLFVHSSRAGDDSVVYDNMRRHRRTPQSCSSALLEILPGVAALDSRPFGQSGIWGEGWRTRREFVGRVGIGVCWRLWNPEINQRFPPKFRAAVRCLLQCAVRPGSTLYFLSDAVIFYVLNMCRWDWFGDTLAGEAAAAGASRLEGRPQSVLSRALHSPSDSDEFGF